MSMGMSMSVNKLIGNYGKTKENKYIIKKE